MYDSILKRLREWILLRQYVMTTHAEEEMENDGLTVFDVEHIILTGLILERQTDLETRQIKYRIRGRVLANEAAEVICRLSSTKKAVIVTVYTL